MADCEVQENKRVLYACPERHEWEDHSDVEAPLVNIKCPHCGKTAMRIYRAQAASRWSVQPLRTLTADVPRDPTERAKAERCTCGTPPFAPPEPADDCPLHGPRRTAT